MNCGIVLAWASMEHPDWMIIVPLYVAAWRYDRSFCCTRLTIDNNFQLDRLLRHMLRYDGQKRRH